MSNPVFPLFGKSRCDLIGRQELFDDVWYSLEKSPPDNVSVVGPLWFGKSTLVHAIVEKAKQAESPFSLVVHWPLGHVCPASNEDFLGSMCDLLSEAIAGNRDVDQSYIGHLSKKTFTSLNEIVKLLDNDGHHLLMVWDGFDKAARQEGLQLSLWDQMREVFSNGHALLIATRQPVSDLIRNEDALVSPLWNQLNQFQVKPLDNDDQAAICKHAGLQMSKGASTELKNWTGGHPLLLLSVVNDLAAKKTKGEVSNELVVEIAKTVGRQIKGQLKEIWSDCIPLLIALGRELADIPRAEVYQLHREPATWEWQPPAGEFSYRVVEPEESHNSVALVLSLSANIERPRVTSVLGEDVSIWEITHEAPNNDFLKSRDQLSQFRETLRGTFNQIKKAHGEEAQLNIFPAVPVACAIEIGRTWMPKADLPFVVYDQNRKLGGFTSTLEIKQARVVSFRDK